LTIRTVFEKLKETYDRYYNSSQHLAIDKVIVKFKARLYSDSTFQRIENFSGSKFTNCVMKQGTRVACTWVNLGKDSQSASDDITATHETVGH
jgi:hypothetical protein